MKHIMLLLAAVLMVGTVNAQNEKAKKKADKNAAYTVLPAPKATTGPEILKEIVKSSKGKVAVLDFWATWCGPCMRAMETIKPLKEQLKEERKNVEFVYIAGENSPLEKYNSTIPYIHGKHVRLSKDQWQALCTHLNLKGIPSYMIVDKNGAPTWDNIASGGFPGNETLSAEIENALKKK